MKFNITRHRMVRQSATVTINVKDGELPLDRASALADSKWKWADVAGTEAELSPDIAPVATEASDA